VGERWRGGCGGGRDSWGAASCCFAVLHARRKMMRSGRAGHCLLDGRGIRCVGRRGWERREELRGYRSEKNCVRRLLLRGWRAEEMAASGGAVWPLLWKHGAVGSRLKDFRANLLVGGREAPRTYLRIRRRQRSRTGGLREFMRWGCWWRIIRRRWRILRQATGDSEVVARRILIVRPEIPVGAIHIGGWLRRWAGGVDGGGRDCGG